DDDDRLYRGRELFEPPCRGGYGSFVSYQQMPVKSGRDEERTAGDCRSNEMSGFRLLCPVGRGAIVAQNKINIQLVALSVIPARRVVAHHGAWLVSIKDQAIGPESRHTRLRAAGVGQQQLYVIIKGRRVKARQVVARERDSPQIGTQVS